MGCLVDRRLGLDFYFEVGYKVNQPARMRVIFLGFTMGNRGDRGSKGKPRARTSSAQSRQKRHKAGYEYLLAYKLTLVIYDYAVQFTNRWINKYSRTHDQWVQAARSGTQNVAEGNKQQSLRGYIKLTGVARGSLEELLKDCLAFCRQNGLTAWPAERAKREIREIWEIWEIMKASPTLPNNPNFPPLPQDQEKAINLLITLINQANYLLDNLIESLKEKHMKEGGFTEKLYQRRRLYRGY